MNIVFGDIVIPIPSLGFLVFAQLAGLAIVSAVLMITQRDAVHSALWLVVTFFSLAGMYVMLGAEFLAALQVLVYTGAILVLFLFVILLLNLRADTPKLVGVHFGQVISAWPVGLVLLGEIVTVILFTNLHPLQQHIGDQYGNSPSVVWSTTQISQVGGNVVVLGNTLYTQFLFPFEVASLILLLAVLGAIVLARKEEPAEVEEVVPTVGISLGRRSVSDSPQEAQMSKKLLPAVGRRASDAQADDYELPTVDQPSGVGAGTTSGVDLDQGKK
jgi:NADH-quinone oxidoreductase subunit J